MAIQNALYNGTWHLTVEEITEPNLEGQGPVYDNLAGGNSTHAWEYCTISSYGDYCDKRLNGSGYVTAPPGAPPVPDAAHTWSQITLNNHTYALRHLIMLSL